MVKQNEVQWEVMQNNDEWEEMNEKAWASATSAGADKKRHIAYSLLLVASLAFVVLVSFWNEDPSSDSLTPSTAAESPIRPRIVTPKVPLEYWEDKFY